jgi:hypothetical protein
MADSPDVSIERPCSTGDGGKPVVDAEGTDHMGIVRDPRDGGSGMVSLFTTPIHVRGMSSQSERSSACGPGLPVSIPARNELSWILGDRVTTGAEATLLGECEHERSHRSVALFSVTDHTVVFRVRTPVGRHRYFGASRAEAEGTLDRLAAQEGWCRGS